MKEKFFLVLGVVFLGQFASAMPYSILPAIFLNPDYSIFSLSWTQGQCALFLGATLAAGSLGQFLFQPFLGVLSDRYGRFNVACLNFFCSTLFYSLMAVAIGIKQVYAILPIQFLGNMFEGTLFLGRAMVVDLQYQSKDKSLGMVDAAVAAAYVAGPLFSAFILHLFHDAAYIFFSMSAIYCITGMLCYFMKNTFIEERVETKIKTSTLAEFNLFNKLKRLFSEYPEFKIPLLSFIAQMLALDIFYAFSPFFLSKYFLFSPKMLALYNASLSVAIIIGAGYVADYLKKLYPNQKILFFSSGLFAANLFLFASIHKASASLLFFILIGLSSSISVVNLTAQISETTDKHVQGEVMGVQNALRMLANTLLCLFGGALFSVSPLLIFLIATFLCAFSLMYYMKKGKNNEGRSRYLCDKKV